MIGRRSALADRGRLGWVASAGAIACLTLAVWAPAAHAAPW